MCILAKSVEERADGIGEGRRVEKAAWSAGGELGELFGSKPPDLQAAPQPPVAESFKMCIRRRYTSSSNS